MYLSKLKTYHLRNLTDGELLFSPGANFIFGQNGQGKTNIVEAISVISAGKSFRTSELRELIRWNEDSASLFGTINTSAGEDELGMVITTRERSATVNGNPVKTIAEFVGRLLSVTFSPGDLELVKGGPQERRRFIDRHVVDVMPQLMRDLIEYHRALKHKNALLRQEQTRPSDLESWNSILATKAARIMPARLDLIAALGAQANQVYQGIAANDGALELRYHPSFKSAQWDAAALMTELMGNAEREIQRRTASLGIQRDDVGINLGGHPAGDYASQGQTRSIVLSLKLGVIELLEQRRGESPVVLLDDVDSELDQRRSDALFARIYQTGRQVFVTGTDRDSVTRLRQNGAISEFIIDRGQVVRPAA